LVFIQKYITIPKPSEMPLESSPAEKGTFPYPNPRKWILELPRGIVEDSERIVYREL
jgi:hypothetical protein